MLGLKNLAMLPSYFDCVFVYLKQKAHLRPDLSPKFLTTLGPNPTRKARPDLQLWKTQCLRPSQGLKKQHGQRHEPSCRGQPLYSG